MFLKNIPVPPLDLPITIISAVHVTDPFTCSLSAWSLSVLCSLPHSWWRSLLWSMAERWCDGCFALYKLSPWGVHPWLYRPALPSFSVLINVSNYSQSTGSQWETSGNRPATDSEYMHRFRACTEFHVLLNFIMPSVNCGYHLEYSRVYDFFHI